MSEAGIENNVKVLGSLGLSVEEEDLYRVLLAHPMLTLREAAEQTRAIERDARRLLKSLEDKGLVTLVAGRPLRFRASPPEAALGALLHEREGELSKVRGLLPSLIEEFHSAAGRDSPLGAVEVISGVDAVATRWFMVQRSVDEEICLFDTPPYMRVDENELEILKRGVAYRVIYTPGAVEADWQLENFERCIAAGEQARFVPELPMKLGLVDRRAALVPLYPAVEGGLLIHPSPLLDGIRTMFEMFWDRGVPITALSEVHTRQMGDPVDATDRELLRLMAAGLTDDAIGRRLGVTRRSVQRRVSRLMRELRATNRYQLGLQVERRGLH